MREPADLPGRAAELDLLTTRLRDAAAGRGSVTVIGGEAGSGKSALVNRLMREAGADGALVAAGRAYDMSFTPTFGLWADICADLQAALPATAVEQSPLQRTWRDIQESADSGVHTALFGWVHAAVDAICAERPLVLVLEDLHWADQDSIQLFRHLARRAVTWRVLLVATVDEDQLDRARPVARMLQVIEREVNAVHLGLGPIPHDDLRGWIARRYALPGPDTDRLTAHVQAMTSGNAFFAVELLRALEGTALVSTGSQWQLGPLDAPRLPGRLRQVVESRFVSLSDHDLDLLAAAAIIGPEVDFGLWVRAFGAQFDATEEAMLQVLESAAALSIVEPSGGGSSFRFVHALVHKALYERIFPIRRRQLHRQLADILATSPAPDFETVARHLDAADDPESGGWLVRAGERAESLGALLTAVERYEAALGPLERSGATAAVQAEVLLRLGLLRRMDDARQALDYIERAGRLALVAEDRRLCVRVLAGRGLIRCYAGVLADGLADMDAGLTQLEASPAPNDTGDTDDTDDTDDEASPLATRKLVHRGSQVYWLGSAGWLAEACRLGEAQLERTGRVPGGITAGTAAVQWGLALVDAAQGRVEQAQARFAAASAAHQRTGQARLTFISARDELVYAVLPYRTDDRAERRRLEETLRRLADQGAAARSFVDAIDNINYPLLHVMALDGRWDEAHRVVTAMEGYGIPLLRHVVGAALGPIARAEGDTALAWDLVNEAWPDGPSTDPFTVGWYHTLPQQRLAVELALDAGELDQAADWLAGHERFLKQARIALGTAEASCLRARFELMSGHPAQARRHADTALRIAERPRQPLALVAAHRLVAELAADTDPDDARAHFTAAAALADACGAPYEKILTTLSAAENLPEPPDPAELAEIRTWCTERRAETALTRIERLETRGAARTYPAGLTTREAQVLALLATGLSDREIATALRLSHHTVGRHVEKAYRKIGAHRRAEAASFAVRHGLTLDSVTSGLTS